MKIIVTNHAIERYRQRFFDFSKLNGEIRILLKEVAQKGKYIEIRPVADGKCLEVRYKGISIVIVQKKNRIVIITCLGNMSYRKWMKNQEKNKINGRLLYPA